MFFEKKPVLVGREIVKRYKEILCQAGCMEFLRGFVEEDTSKFLSLPIISDGAAKAIQQALLSRLENLYLQTLIRSLRLAVEEFDLVESMSPTAKSVEALQRAAEKVFNELIQGTGEPLKDKFFFLREYEETIRKNFRDFMQEFLDRITLRQAEISAQFFGGVPITKILALSSEGADTHRHGRNVMRVTTDAGTFYYKPHDCLLDVLYDKIIANWFSDCTTAAAIVSGEGYGFTKELVTCDVDTLEDVEKYFYNFGMLTALFHGLGTVDMHYENIIAIGIRPCAIDLETLFNVERNSSAKVIKSSAATLDFDYSVNRTCIMPGRIHLGGMFSPLYGNTQKNSSLPCFQGVHYTVEGHEERFLSGFNDGYERVLTHRGEIISLTENYKDVTLRIVPRNSNYYAKLLGILHRQENLYSEENRQNMLNNLRLHGKNFSSAVIEHEKKCLLEGEIPYFCARLDGNTLCGDDTEDILQENYFKGSALTSAKFSLNRLSQAEKIFEEEYIRRRFKHAPLDESVSDVRFPIFGEKDLLENSHCAQNIFEELNTDALHTTDGTIAWFSWLLKERVKPSCGLVTPQANAAQYYGKILKCQRLEHLHEQASTLAEECLNALSAQIELWEESDAEATRKLPVGIYDGFGGIILACVELDDEKILRRILKLISDKKIYGGEYINVADGSAGLILSLADCRLQQEVAPIISNCAENILSKEFTNEVDAPTGLAGFGAALAIAYKFTKDKKFLDAAVNAFERIRATYLEHIKGWADTGETIAWLASRAPKSAGIGLCAMCAAKFVATEIFDEVLNLALSSIESETELLWNDSLDNGNALSVLFLARAAKKFERRDLSERAEKILATMNKRAKEIGYYRLTEKGVRTFFEASMFIGSLGIGYAALELENLT